MAFWERTVSSIRRRRRRRRRKIMKPTHLGMLPATGTGIHSAIDTSALMNTTNAYSLFSLLPFFPSFSASSINVYYPFAAGVM